ncbi:DUF983 domain-containing protein [Hymenobacter cellulosivorans]|uniref:DUF983 domain-containing protein n=1 Tax=Hymenobacter cellulosivorans TaxID=2932249 RepID=A0ABY4F913_9BACT|nr:DUF983 domain-containing protein [Hymenobacter cellulosivorans]UOQ52696.1 DUF983 domain-containing protein [Hymenobacter cellulosivorans]
MSRIESSALACLALRCPRCHEGPLFTSPALSIKFSHMHEHCPVCGQAFEPEPGFYWGSMYVSYAFSVAIFTISGVLCYYLLGDPAVWVYVLTVAVASIALMPLVFRYSRAIMLYLFGGVRYNPEATYRAPLNQPSA